ncbi:MAG: GTPase HflX [Vampirovibrionales bacterium]|nr:GTPase HflX [Vampirovibrionales bacterium]
MAEAIAEASLCCARPLTLLLDGKGQIHYVIVGLANDPGALDQVEGLPSPSALMGQRGGQAQKRVDAGPRIIPETEADARGQTNFYAIQTTKGFKPLPAGSAVNVIQYRLAGLVQLAAGTHEKFSQQRGQQMKACDGVIFWSPVYQPEVRVTPPDLQNTSLEEPLQEAALMPLVLEASSAQTARLASETCARETVFEAAKEQYAAFWGWQQAMMKHAGQAASASRPRTFLLGVHPSGARERAKSDSTMAELKELIHSLGGHVVGVMRQSRFKPDSKTYLGEGKALALAMQIQQYWISQVAVDDELSPTQHRELEKLLRVRVLDRSEVILDIFANRARSKEGKLQVELARHRYALPRLVRWRGIFEQQTSVGGGRGMTATRGPGETRIEFERRVLRGRIHQLEEQVEAHVKHRHFQRQRRDSTGIVSIALVGYTNAGKSTLMNALTGAEVWVQNQLFATLDPTIRQLRLPSGQTALLSDTVGFIQKLPTFLIQAFRATLEEVLEADILLHIWDVSHPEALDQLQAVEETLDQLGVQDKPRLTVCNKIDQKPDWQPWLLTNAPASIEPVIAISALTGEGLQDLLAKLDGLCQDLGNPSSLLHRESS